MDQTTKTIIRFIEALADARERLIDFSVRLMKHPSVYEVITTFDCRRYGLQKSTVFELYVDAELVDGTARAWMLDIAVPSEPGWLLEYTIRLNDRQGQLMLKEFPSLFASTLEEFVQALDQAVSDLLDEERALQIIEQTEGENH